MGSGHGRDLAEVNRRAVLYHAWKAVFQAVGKILLGAALVGALLVLPAGSSAFLQRIKNEEQVLAEGLDEYAAYMQRVRYRPIPFVWQEGVYHGKEPTGRKAARKMSQAAEKLIEIYHMKKHVEGGYFSEVYTAPAAPGDRPSAGSIYYLLDAGDVCVFHQLDCDEIYYYHEGCGMKITVLAGGEKRDCLLGGNTQAGERACVILPKGCIFAAENRKDDGYTLVSCMTTPQFEEAGCRLVGKDELRRICPAHYDALAHLAR